MRKILLATVAGISLIASGRDATAQAVVIDPANLAQAISTARGMVQQVALTTQRIQQAQQQYMMLTNTYNALARATDVGGIAMALGGVTRTYMPEASGALSTIQQGSSLFNSMTRNRNANSVMTQLPQALRGMRTTENWLADMERREIATANAQAIAQAGTAEMAQRIAALQAAQLAISTAPTLQSLTAANGLIAVSGQNIAMHQASIASVQLALATEERAERQRDEQRQVQSAGQWASSTEWALQNLRR